MGRATEQHIMLTIIFIVAVVAIIAMLPWRLPATSTNTGGEAVMAPSIQQAMLPERALLNERTPEALTINLLRAQQNRRPDQLFAVAQERREMLAQRIKTDPAAVLRVALDKEALDRMPSDVQDLLEQRVSVTGTLELSIADIADADGKLVRSESFYDLRTRDGKKLHLRFVGEPDALPGSTIEADGVQLGDDVALSAADVTVTNEVMATTTTQRTVAVILFNFQNNPTQPFTPATAKSIMFGDVRRYHEENSLGQVTLVGKYDPTGDVFGWYTIPYDNVNCSANIYTWSTAAKQQAEAAGVNVSGYQHINYAFPASCGWAGLGQVGPRSTTIESWVVSGAYRLGTVGHEIGHNMGVRHASSYSCYENNARVPLSANCTLREYGDPFDIMGTSSSHAHFNNYHKIKTTYPRVLNTLTVTSPGTYIIAPTEYLSSETQSLRVARDVNIIGTAISYLYIEYRRPYGFDGFSPTDPVANGVTIRYAPETATVGNSKLLDMTSSTTTFTDASLAVGKTFTDRLTGWSVTTLGVNATHAIVQITNESVPCTRVAPMVSLSPSSQWGAPGQALTYQLTVTNTDTIGCPDADFTIVPTLPEGWSQTSASIRVSPGTGQTVSITVTSSASATEGFYNITETVTNTASGMTRIAGASYNVRLGDVTPPLVSITSPPDGTRIGKGRVMAGAAASDASGIASLSLSLDGRTLKTCATASCTVKLSKVSTGPHTIAAVATDNAGNSARTSITVYG